MNKKTLWALAVMTSLLLGASSCQKEDIQADGNAQESSGQGPDIQTGKLLTFKASDGDCNMSLQKNAYKDASTNGTIIWQKGDDFSIATETGQGTYEYVTDKGTACNIDGSQCEISVKASGYTGEGASYAALYPYTEGAVVDFSACSFTLPARQKVKAGQFDPKADFMIALTTEKVMAFNFKHMVAKLGITVPIEGVKSITIISSQPLAGKMSASYFYSKNNNIISLFTPKVIENTETYSITLSCTDNNGVFEKGKTYYACVAPTKSESKIRITFNTSSSETSKYVKCKIGQMACATRSTADPSGIESKYFHSVEKASVSGDDKVFTTWMKRLFAEASKITFTYPEMFYNDGNFEQIEDDNVKNIFGDNSGIEVWHSTNGTNQFYIVSEKEICPAKCYSSIADEYAFTPYGLFQGLKSLTKITFTNFNTEEVEDFSYMFSLCEKLNYIDASGISTNNAEKLDGMFYNCPKLQEIDISSFNAEKVTSTSGMFSLCKILKSISLPKFSKLIDISNMFQECIALESIDISNIYMDGESNSLLMTNLFESCSSLTTIYARSGQFDASKVDKSLNGGSYMFINCDELIGGNNYSFKDNANDIYAYGNEVDVDYARIDGEDGKPGFFTAKK